MLEVRLAREAFRFVSEPLLSRTPVKKSMFDVFRFLEVILTVDS